MKNRLLLSLAITIVLSGLAGLRQVSSRSFDRVVSLPGDPVAVAVDNATGRAFVINGADYTVGVLDTASGDLLRSVSVGRGALSILVAESAHRVFVPNSGDNTVSVLDGSSGLAVRTTALGFTPRLVAVDERSGRVYVTSAGGDVLATLDARAGNLLGTLRLRRVLLALAVDPALHRLLLANADNTVQAIDAGTGRVLFDVRVSGYPSTIDVDEQTGRVFVGDALHAQVSTLDARTGATLGRAQLASSPEAFVVLNGLAKVFVACVPSISGSSGVAVLDARTGQLLQEMPLSQNPANMIGDDRNDTLLLDVGNAVLAVRVADPSVVRTYPVLGARFTAQGMAIDRRTGHLFVVNTDNSNDSATTSGFDVLGRWIPWLRSRTLAPYGSLNEFAISN